MSESENKPKKTRVKRRSREKMNSQKKANKKRANLSCSWYKNNGNKCPANVSYTDTLTGENFCNYHKHMYYKKGLAAHMLELRGKFAVDQAIKKKMPHKKIKDLTPSEQEVIDKADEKIEETQKEIEENEASFFKDFKIKAGKQENLQNIKGGQYASFVGIDIDYYTPDFKDDQWYLLNTQIRRCHAIINVLMQMILRAEEEAEMLKVTEMEGNQIIEGNSVSFGHKTTRHSTPMEMQIQLMNTLAKHEANYSRLIKQREELLINALLVLRRFGIKWSKEAGTMIADVIENGDYSRLEGAGYETHTPEAMGSGLVKKGDVVDIPVENKDAAEVMDEMEGW